MKRAAPLLLLVACAAPRAKAPAPPPPPPAPVLPRWQPAVAPPADDSKDERLRFAEAEHAYARAVLDGLLLRARVKDRLDAIGERAPSPVVRVAQGKTFVAEGGVLRLGDTRLFEAEAIAAFAPSPDARRVAVAHGTRAPEGLVNGAIAILDANGKVLESIDAGASSLAWSADGLFYVAEHGLHLHGRTLEPRAADEVVASDDGKRVLVRAGAEVALYEAGAFRKLSAVASRVAFAPDGKPFALAKRKLVQLDPPREVAETHASDLVVTKTAAFAIGEGAVRRFARDPKPEPLAHERPPKKAEPVAPRGTASALLPFGPATVVDDAVRAGDDVLFRVESHLEPSRWLTYRANEHRLVPTPWAAKPLYDTSDLEVVLERCGRGMPLVVLRKRAGPAGLGGPVLLTLDAGPPRMRGSDRVWLDEGGIVAFADTRREGVKAVVTACARALGPPERIALRGAGAAAAIDVRPAPVRALVADTAPPGVLPDGAHPAVLFLAPPSGDVVRAVAELQSRPAAHQVLLAAPGSEADALAFLLYELGVNRALSR